MSGRPGPRGGARGVAPGQKPRDFGAAARRLVGALAPERWRILAALVLSGASVALNVAAPRLLGHGTDLIFNGVVGKLMPAGVSKVQFVAALRARGEGQLAEMVQAMDVAPGRGVDFGALGRILLLVALLYVAAAVLQWVAGLLIRVLVQNTGWHLRERIQRKIDRLPLAYLDSHGRGDLLSRVTNDIDNVTQTMLQTLAQLFTAVLTVAGIFGMMLAMSWQLTLVSLIVVPVGAWLTAHLMRRAQPHFREQWRSTGAVGDVVEESMTGHEVVSLFNLQRTYSQAFSRANDSLYRSAFRAQFLSMLVNPLMQGIANLSYVIVAVGGGVMVANGAMSIGGVQAFIQYSRQFSQPLTQLASMASSLQSGIASAERVFDLLDAPEMAPERGTAALPPSSAHTGRLEFEHVRFGYDPQRPVITDLTLAVEPGQMVAIIGPTGAGKTTLVNLLLRFYEVDAGAIRIDGVDIHDVPADALRSRIGMVLQDTWLFDGTIEQNIAFGREGATHEDVVAAARATAVDRLIRQLPDGYQTRVSDDGQTVSAGERQLLTIARAFLSQPDLLILDEATSSVDTRTEVVVQRAMDRLRRGRTALVIAHRLSTIRDADLILVMEHGDVVETGRHADLLARGGAYARLYQAQFAGPEQADAPNAEGGRP